MIVTTEDRFYQLPPGQENSARHSVLSLWLCNKLSTWAREIVSDLKHLQHREVTDFFLVNVSGLARLMELRSYNVGFDSLPKDAMNESMSVTEKLRSYPSPNLKLTRSCTDTDIDTK